LALGAVPLFVVRHARAGHSSEWEGDDRLRPLDEKGRRQAAELPGLLARFEIARIVSGSYLRCMQTVEPLSEQRGLPIEERRELDEGASLVKTLALLREVGDDAVLCTQGDVLENLFGESGQKGSTRIVELQNGEPAVLGYLPPPA
jgi:broad specificity phosphatase PhoE